MGAKINIHRTHRHLTNGLDVVEVEGSTVGDCLNHLFEQFPGMKEAVFDKQGRLLNVVEIFVNHQSAYPDELSKPIKDGDEIHIILMLAGG